MCGIGLAKQGKQTISNDQQRRFGCPWNGKGADEAAPVGESLEVLEWTRWHGWAWNIVTCASGATGVIGHSVVGPVK